MVSFKTVLITLFGLASSELACNRSFTATDGSAPKFFSENIRAFGRGVFDLNLIPTPMTTDPNIARRQVIFGRRSSYRLAFFKVSYERQTPGDEGRVVATNFVGDMQITEQSLLARKIPISTQRPQQTLENGAYAAVLCENLSPCAPPMLETLTAYKSAVQKGVCGNANKNGNLDESCGKMLLRDSVSDVPFLGVAYPLTVRNGKFVTGDDRLNYVGGTRGDLNLADPNGGSTSGSLAINSECSDRLAASSPRLGGFNARMLDSDLCASGIGTADGLDSVRNLATDAVTSQFDGQATSIFNKLPERLAATRSPLAGGPFGLGDSDCFLPGTPVAVVVTQSGSLQSTEKKVEDLKVGDHVYNPLLRKAFPIKIVHHDQKSGEAYYQLSTAETSSLRVTSVHPLVTPEGYTSADLLYKKIVQGKKMYVLTTKSLPVRERTDFQWTLVTEMKPIPSSQAYDVYNFEVDLQRPLVFPGDNGWVFPMTTASGNQCEVPSCSEFYASSNGIVTGDFSRQRIQQELLQQSMAGLNAAFAPPVSGIQQVVK